MYARSLNAAPGYTSYTHTQNVASAVWTVTHNLGRYPAVTVVDAASNRVFAEVIYLDVNTLTVRFGGSYTGRAFCS